MLIYWEIIIFNINLPSIYSTITRGYLYFQIFPPAKGIFVIMWIQKGGFQQPRLGN